MKKTLFVFLAGIIGFYGLSFAFNEFSYENAKSLANEYIANSSFDENWKDTHPHIEGEGKYFYTDADTPSYVEFKVSCDKTKDCGFVMVNFDGDDVSVPIASTSGNTPSEVLAAKNGNDGSDNKLYYFNPFEQYAENELTGDVASIDPQDDFSDEVSGTGNITPEIKKEKKAKKNKSLKDKILKAKSEAKEFKKSDDFKKKKKELKDKKQTIPKEEVSFKYLDMALADVGNTGTTGYTPPSASNIILGGGSSSSSCAGNTPCYDQFQQNYNGTTCYSGCSPTAIAILYGYYDRNGKSNLVPGTAGLTNDYNTVTLVNTLRTLMGTYCSNGEGATYYTSVSSSINYAKNNGYPNSSAYYSGVVGYANVFNKVKSEVNAGRPLIVMNNSHTMVAFGYNSTSGLPIVRLNMGWGTTPIKGVNGLYYNSSSIDYNISSMYYNNAAKTPIDKYVSFNIN